MYEFFILESAYQVLTACSSISSGKPRLPTKISANSWTPPEKLHLNLGRARRKAETVGECGFCEVNVV